MPATTSLAVIGESTAIPGVRAAPNLGIQDTAHLASFPERDSMKINLVRYNVQGDGSRTDPESVEWDTNEDLSFASGRYGGVYRFAGIEIEPDGGLILTMRFRDVGELDAFADICQHVWSTPLTVEDASRWQSFTDSLRTLVREAPRRTMPTLYDEPQPIEWKPKTHSPEREQLDQQAWDDWGKRDPRGRAEYQARVQARTRSRSYHADIDARRDRDDV